MLPTYLDPEAAQRHKLLNRLQTLLLLGGSVVLLMACGWILAGPEGAIWALVLGVISLAFAPRMAPAMILRLYGAAPVSPWDLPEVTAILEELARRAELPRVPELYYVPSAMLNAFAVGRCEQSAIALTDGLLRHLTLRELAGVLGHEVSHIRNGDLWLMNLADTVSRLTRMMSLFGQILLLLNLPLLLAGEATVPWPLVLLLVAAPTIVALLQLALSRTREYDADLDAAFLTGDPLGLVGALQKLERYGRGTWEMLAMPGRRNPAPSLLRTHPPTDRRIRRLLDLRGRVPERRPTPVSAVPTGRFAGIDRQPRYRMTGLWH
jgi:heat shock protein HtpX